MKMRTESIWLRTIYTFSAADLRRMAEQRVYDQLRRGAVALSCEWDFDADDGPVLRVIHDAPKEPVDAPKEPDEISKVSS